jgi:ABC-2 type transport system permease protein
MLRNVFSKSLWDARRSLLAWAVGIAAVAVMYAAFYPSMNTPEMAGAMESYPEGLRTALNLDDLTSPAGYLGGTVFGILGPVLLILFATGFGARAIAGDEENGVLDLILAYPVSRVRVALERFAALVAAVLIVGGAVLVALLAIAGPAELSISAGNFTGATLQLALLGLCFGALAFAIGAATGRRGAVLAVTGIVAVLTYFANTLAPQVAALAWLQDLSPFHYYAGGQPLRNGLQAGDAAILLLVAVVLLAAGTVVFNRRDVAV